MKYVDHVWTNCIGFHLQKGSRVTRRVEGENIMVATGQRKRAFVWLAWRHHAEPGICKERLSSMLRTVSNAAEVHWNIPFNEPQFGQCPEEDSTGSRNCGKRDVPQAAACKLKSRGRWWCNSTRAWRSENRENDGVSLCTGPATMNEEGGGRSSSLLRFPYYPIAY